MVSSKLVFFGMVLLILFSCGTLPRSVKENFTLCYDGHPRSKIDSVLNTRGYFERDFMRMSFFENGLVVYNFGSYEYKPDELFRVLSDCSDINEYKSFFVSFWWGTYSLCGDTLILQTTVKPASGTSFNGAWEDKFKILDRNTLEKVAVRPLEDFDESRMRTLNAAKSTIIGRVYKFVPTEYFPKADSCWLLKEDWFWCKNRAKLGLKVTD